MSSDKKINTKATGVIAIAVMCSRILGLCREILFNSLFGSSLMGIFLIAFRAPNLLRDLFAEGALSVSFITVFSQKMETEGEQSAWALASKMLTLCTIMMSVITLFGIIFAKQFIEVLAPGLHPHDAAVAVLLTQIMYPFILLVSLAAIVMGILNTKNVFGAPAIASSFFNIGSILGGIGFGWVMDPSFGEKALIGLAIGTLIGGLLQLITQVPSLKRIHYQFKPDFSWRDKGIRRILILTLPAIIAASAVQINVLVNSAFASYISKECVTWLNSAFRLMQLPIGVFGVAVATVTLPVLSRMAVSKESAQFGPTLGRALRLALFLTMPAAVGLWFFAYPIISIIYQHGKFHEFDVLQTSLALQYYVLGLVFYACIKVLSPAFYAINKKWVPMMTSFLSIFLNVVLNMLFVFKFDMKHCGLALSTSIAACFNCLILYGFLSCWHNLSQKHLFTTLFRCGIASLVLGGVSWLTVTNMMSLTAHSSLLIQIIALLLAIICSGLIYFVLSTLLRIEAAQELLHVIKTKLIKKRVRVKSEA